MPRIGNPRHKGVKYSGQASRERGQREPPEGGTPSLVSLGRDKESAHGFNSGF